MICHIFCLQWSQASTQSCNLFWPGSFLRVHRLSDWLTGAWSIFFAISQFVWHWLRLPILSASVKDWKSATVSPVLLCGESGLTDRPTHQVASERVCTTTTVTWCTFKQACQRCGRKLRGFYLYSIVKSFLFSSVFLDIMLFADVPPGSVSE